MAENKIFIFLCYVTVLSRKRRGKNSAKFVSQNVAEFWGNAAENKVLSTSPDFQTND